MTGSTKVETRGDSLFWVTVVFPAIAWLLYIGTFVHKLRSSRFGKEDVMLAIAALILTAQTAMVFECIRYGFGKHAKDIAPEDLRIALEYFFIMQVLYKPLGGFVKLAFLCLYDRVFEQPRFRKLVRCFMVYVAMGTVAFTIASIFQCWPISYGWNKHQKGHCIQSGPFWYAHAAWHVTSDFVIFLMPVPIIMKLNMLKARKMALAAVFSLGLFTCIASAIRMSTLLASSKSNEPTWGSYDGMQWTQIDSCFSIICACLPILRKPFSDFMHHLGFQRTTAADSSCPLDDIHTSGARSRHRTLWDPIRKEWFEEQRNNKHLGIESRRNSMGSESVMGIVRTTDVEIMRYSIDVSAKSSNESRTGTEKDLVRGPRFHMV